MNTSGPKVPGGVVTIPCWSKNGSAFTLYQLLFERSVIDRLKPFDSGAWEFSAPPVVFPWELFEENGEFIKYQNFIFEKEAKKNQEHAEAALIYNLHHTVWRCAKAAVQKAQKISFVGLSMHEYLRTGFKFLFDGKGGRVEVVVANTDNAQFAEVEYPETVSSGSPRHRVLELLTAVAPQMQCMNSTSEFIADMRTYDRTKQGEGTGIAGRQSFQDFIKWEMD